MANALRIVAANDEACRTGHDWTRVLLSAVVRNAFGDQSVNIREVSAKGAIIQAGVAPPAGSRVLLMRGALAVMGTVAWCERGRYCLEFQDLVDLEEWLIPIASGKKLGKPLKPLFPLPDEVSGLTAKH